MITFKDFLTEQMLKPWTIDKLKVDQAIELLNIHCKNGLTAIENGCLLYRGEKKKNSIPFQMIDASRGERTSKDTNNIYQLMMDNSTALANYPKRSKSLICSTSYSEARDYGIARVIIPFDDVEIAV